MNLYILLFVLLLIAWGDYSINHGEILSATLIMSVIYIGLTVVAISARNYFSIDDISWKSLVIIPTALIFFGAGELFGKRGYFKRQIEKEIEYQKPSQEILISKIFVIFTLLFSIVTAYLCFTDLMRFASRAGLGGDFYLLFGTLRTRLVRGIISYERSTLLNQMVIIDETLCFMLLYIFVHNLVFFGRRRLFELAPILPYMIVLFSTTSRTVYIEFLVVAAFIVFILLKIKTDWTRRSNSKIVKVSIIVLIVFYALFRFLGIFTMKTNSVGAIENLYDYFASSLYGFDSFINSNYETSSVFAAQTMRSAYIILNMFGFGIPITAEFNPYYPIGNTYTVMLTGLYRPIVDFTVLGMLLSRVLIGFIYGRIIRSLKRIQAYNFLIIIFSGLLFYPLVMNPLSDLFGRIISFGYIYRLFYLWLAQKIILEKKLRGVNYE